MKKVISLLLFSASMLFSQNNMDALEILKNEQPSATYEAFFELAKSGDVDAQTLVGEMYLDGIGVKTDYEKAFFWLSKAAQREDSQAQYLVGYMYENGLYVAKDIVSAVKWYKKAALRGDVMAQYNLALIYKDGRDGIQKNMKEAFKWLKMVEEEEEKITKIAMK
jgi:TPR repeat protein